MHEYQARHRIKRILYSKISVVALAITAIILGRSVLDVYFKERDSAQKISSAQAALEKLNDRSETLNTEIQSLKTTDGLESEIRASYNVAKPGEKILVIVEDEKPTTTVQKKEKGFWSWIFGR